MWCACRGERSVVHWRQSNQELEGFTLAFRRKLSSSHKHKPLRGSPRKSVSHIPPKSVSVAKSSVGPYIHVSLSQMLNLGKVIAPEVDIVTSNWKSFLWPTWSGWILWKSKFPFSGNHFQKGHSVKLICKINSWPSQRELCTDKIQGKQKTGNRDVVWINWTPHKEVSAAECIGPKFCIEYGYGGPCSRIWSDL